MKVLIAFGDSSGATSEMAGEIAKIFRGEGLDVKVTNLKEERMEDISEYDLVVVGSEVQVDKWSVEAERFLSKFHESLAKKKLAIFVSSALFALSRIQGKKAEVDRANEKYLKQKAAAYSLTPIAMEIFGGVLDFNQMGFLARKTLGWAKTSFEAEGYTTTRPGVYDTRDWNSVKEWARTLVLKARYL